MTHTVKLFFKEGDDVAHKENITLKLEVKRIVIDKKSFKDDDGTKITRRHIAGIECGWWNGEDYMKEIFHSNSIIPWDIAMLGHASVMRYLTEKKEMKKQ